MFHGICPLGDETDFEGRRVAGGVQALHGYEVTEVHQRLRFPAGGQSFLWYQREHCGLAAGSTVCLRFLEVWA